MRKLLTREASTIIYYIAAISAILTLRDVYFSEHFVRLYMAATVLTKNPNCTAGHFNAMYDQQQK